jgi:hypothetical protein
MPFRMGLRPLRTAFQPFRSVLVRKPAARRWQSSTPEPAPVAPKASNNPFAWNSPVGPKTVHFWYVHNPLGWPIATSKPSTRS